MNEPDAAAEEVIFSSALECAPAGRAAFLDQACAGQTALRQRIEDLLAAQLRLGEFMEPSPGMDETGGLDFSPATASLHEEPGTRIGRYRLLKSLGEGGCGVVYLAEQEEPVRRPVALKLIKPGMDTRSVIARFEAERQALALMEHPNIARVLDAGATPNGRPYFAMELVQGTRITEFCEQNGLATRDRLGLFVQVCHAVQHAHQKGIVHRDLKPSNILVTHPAPGAPGLPKVIDFGIAKAMEGRLTDRTLFTAFGQFLGTPAYMSPEQALGTGEDIDTRSDIYSLGVVLYELLTGQTPLDMQALRAAGIDEVRRAIRETQPPTPSTRLTQVLSDGMRNSTGAQRPPASEATESHAALRRRLQELRRDLDWIVMKCLEKDRTRRYATANALAMDLERHLANEPVLARPPSRLYEFSRTVRRHRVGFSATAAVMIALAAGIGISAVQSRRARQAELRARRTGYVADMDLASRAVDEGDLGTARTLLRRHVPGPRDPDLRRWEWRYLTSLSDGDPCASLEAHSSRVWSLRFFDKDHLLTTGEADWRTIQWDIQERRPSIIVTNSLRFGGVSSLMVVAPRRNSAFYRPAWSKSPSLRVVDFQARTDRSLLDEKGEPVDVGAPVTSLDISPAQDALAVAFADRVGIWDLERKQWQGQFKSGASAVTRSLFSPDGRSVLIADVSGQVALWSLADDRKTGVFRITDTGDGLWDLRLSKDGRWLVNPGGHRPTEIWSVENGTLVAKLIGTAFVERAAFSPDNRWLATVGGDASVRLWKTSGWSLSRTLHGHTDPVVALDISEDGRLLATGARNGEVRLWSLDERPAAVTQVTLPAATYFKLAADGSAFGRTLREDDVRGVASWKSEVWTAAPLQKAFTVALPAGGPSSGVVLPGGRGLVLGGFDGALRCFGLAFGAGTVVVSNVHAGEIYLMEASMDGRTLVTKGLADNAAPEDRVCVWKLPGLERVAELPHAESVHGIGISDDGRWLAGFTGPGDVGVWEVPSMKGPPLWRGLGAHLWVLVAAFSPDNRWLAAATPDGGAYIWNLETRRRTVLPRALTMYTSLSFSPDGSRLVAGADGEGKLFDAATGQVVLSFRSPGLQLGFARDGEGLLAVQAAGAAVWRAPAFDKLRFAWLGEQPSSEPPPFPGPNPEYIRPGRLQGARIPR